MDGIVFSITYIITCITTTIDVNEAHTTEERITNDNQSAEENRWIIGSTATITLCTNTINDRSTEDKQESSCLTN